MIISCSYIKMCVINFQFENIPTQLFTKFHTNWFSFHYFVVIPSLLRHLSEPNKKKRLSHIHRARACWVTLNMGHKLNLNCLEIVCKLKSREPLYEHSNMERQRCIWVWNLNFKFSSWLKTNLEVRRNVLLVIKLNWNISWQLSKLNNWVSWL